MGAYRQHLYVKMHSPYSRDPVVKANGARNWGIIPLILQCCWWRMGGYKTYRLAMRWRIWKSMRIPLIEWLWSRSIINHPVQGPALFNFRDEEERKILNGEKRLKMWAWLFLELWIVHGKQFFWSARNVQAFLDNNCQKRLTNVTHFLTTSRRICCIICRD